MIEDSFSHMIYYLTKNFFYWHWKKEASEARLIYYLIFVTTTLICASLNAVVPFINCRVVGLVRQLQGQLFSVTRTKVLKPNVRVSVTAAGTNELIACG